MIESTEFSLSTHRPRSRCAPTAVCAQFLVSVLFVMPSHDREKPEDHGIECSYNGYDDAADFIVCDKVLTAEMLVHINLPSTRSYDCNNHGQ